MPFRVASIEQHAEAAIGNAGGVSRLANVIAQTMATGGDVKLPSVPRTGQDRAGQASLPQRTAGVGADAVEYMPFAVDIENGEQQSFRSDLHGLAWPKLRSLDEPDLSRHITILKTLSARSAAASAAQPVRPGAGPASRCLPSAGEWCLRRGHD